MPQPSCTHLNQIRDVKPSAGGCKECLKMKDRWVHLRMCLTCGHVGLLRFLKEQALDEALSRDHSPHHPLY
jgi:hypothetical protein